MSMIQASDGMDELRTVGDNLWRVRVRLHEEKAAVAPANGSEVSLAPSIVSLVVSVALMADQATVATDHAGRFKVFDGHTITIQRESLENQINIETVIEDAITMQIESAAKQLAGRNDLSTALARWNLPSQ